MEYFSVADPKKPLFKPGTDGIINLFRGHTLIDQKSNSDNMIYKIAFKDGSELPSTLHYMKNLIKATIDIYKEQQNIDAVNPSDMIWRDKENAALKIIREGGIGNQLIDYNFEKSVIQLHFDLNTHTLYLEIIHHQYLLLVHQKNKIYLDFVLLKLLFLL